MAGERGAKVCMVTYSESPASLPPMLHTGLSLAAEGIEVEALCLGRGPGTAESEVRAAGFRTRWLALRTREAFHALFGHATRHRTVAALQYVLSYGEYVAKATVLALGTRADLYEANDLPALLPAVLAAGLRRRPVVYRAHEIWSETHAEVRFARAWRWLERALVPRCDEVVTPDEHRSRIYQEEFGARRPPLTVRNCPPFRAPVQSTLLRDELARRGLPFRAIVLYQGLVESGRCIEEIAEATRHFAEGVYLVILGGGFGKWADPAAALAGYDRIVVLGRVPYEALPAYTASADVGILLYRNDCRNNYYCAPNKVFEYMMMGLPVVAANYPGMRRLVEGEGVGSCVDPSDPRDIAAAVNRIVADREAWSRMHAAGLRLSAERYNWAEEYRPLGARYRALIAGEPAAG